LYERRKIRQAKKVGAVDETVNRMKWLGIKLYSNAITETPLRQGPMAAWAGPGLEI
jgi:hypothetical protein